MSITAINWAWKQNNLKAHTKIILVLLAYRANKSYTCFPSINRIAQDTGQTPRSVKNGINEFFPFLNQKKNGKKKNKLREIFTITFVIANNFVCLLFQSVLTAFLASRYVLLHFLKYR